MKTKETGFLSGTGEIVNQDFGEQVPKTTPAEETHPRPASSELTARFKKAVEELVYISESDAPFTVFCGVNQVVAVNASSLLQQFPHQNGVSIEMRDAEMIFKRLVTYAPTPRRSRSVSSNCTGF